MTWSLRRVEITLIIREHIVRGSVRSSVASATRDTLDADGLEHALRDVIGALRRECGGAPRVSLRILLGCHAVRLRLVEGIPRSLRRGALVEFFREGLPRLLAVPATEVACVFAREGGAHLVAAYDRQALAALHDVASRLDAVIEAIVPELFVRAAALRNGGVETRDGRRVGRVDVLDGTITGTSLRRVAADGPDDATTPLDGQADDITVTRAQQRRVGALAAPRPTPTLVQVSRARAGVAIAAAAAAALLLAAFGPLHALYGHARAQREVAKLLAAHPDALGRQQELLALRETIADASRLAVARPSVLRTIASLTTALPEPMSVLHLELDSLGGSAVILAPRAGEALARFDRVAGIANAAFSGPITRETGFGQSKDRATIAFQLVDARRAP